LIRYISVPLVLFFLYFSSVLFAQKNQKQLAYQYYQNADYVKAISIYEQIFQDDFEISCYNPYFISLIKIEEYKKAESLALTASKLYVNNKIYLLEVGIAQQKAGNRKKSERTYNKLLTKFEGNKSMTINFANAFIRNELYEEALDIYILSEDLKPKNTFYIQKAQLYANLGDSESMLFEYMKELLERPHQKPYIMSQIQRFVDNDGIKNDKNYQLVKRVLLKYVKQEKDRMDFIEILIWLFMQNHQFEMALQQAKALDRRNDSDGQVVFDLAETFLDKKYYELAIDAYDYVIDKGLGNHLFIESNTNKLYSILKGSDKNSENLYKVDDMYKKTINDLGYNKNTVLLLSNYAHFKAFYLFDLNSAEQILNDAMKIPQITSIDLAECKLEYADIRLLLGDVWESLLFYSQVEKEFKEHPIGHEAKLRRAKIAYYQGDFNWAQAQLNTLKASTSKLIANDAMDLSLLIIDNYNMDTILSPMSNFASADLLTYQQKYSEAINRYDSVLLMFPGHSLSDEIYMRKADIYMRTNNIDMALDMYERIILEFSYDILVDDALYNKAKIYDEVLQKKEEAMELYEKILIEYQGSVYTIESRKRFRELRGDNLNN
jgi:tetratricopeptide (TPR) repeat protein